MSVKDPKSNKKQNDSQNETGKVLSFPNKKNFGPQDGSPHGDGQNADNKTPLHLVPPPTGPSAPMGEPGMSTAGMSGKWSRGAVMKAGMMFAFLLGVIVTSQMTKYMGEGGRQIASDGSDATANPRSKEAEKALLEKIEKNREPNAVWSLNSIPTEEKFLHGYLLGNYQTTYELSTGLLMSVEYTPATTETRRTPREFSELDREEFFKTYAGLWVQDYVGYEKVASREVAGFVEDTYKIKGVENEVLLKFKVDSKNHLLAIKRAEGSR